MILRIIIKLFKSKIISSKIHYNFKFIWGILKQNYNIQIHFYYYKFYLNINNPKLQFFYVQKFIYSQIQILNFNLFLRSCPAFNSWDNSSVTSSPFVQLFLTFQNLFVFWQNLFFDYQRPVEPVNHEIVPRSTLVRRKKKKSSWKWFWKLWIMLYNFDFFSLFQF